MAATEVISLYSSPARLFASHHLDKTMLASPDLPLPIDLFHKKPVIRSGSCAAPIPRNANSSFTSAASLLKTSDACELIRGFAASGATLGDTLEVPTKPKAVRKPKPDKDDTGKEELVKKPRKQRTKKDSTSTEGVTEVKEKVPRKPRAKKIDTTVEGALEVKVKAPRKPRAKKADLCGQQTLPEGRVTKLLQASKAEKPATPKRTAIVSNYFGPPATVSNAANLLLDDLLLAGAMKRRSDWTPPKPSHSPILIDDQGSEDRLAPSNIPLDVTADFSHILGNYGYDSGEIAAPPQIPEQTGSRKRKLIELVKTNSKVGVPQPRKEKAAKKKARTLTEIATAPYVLGGQEMEPPPLLKYFSSGNTPTDNFKVPSRFRTRSPAKVDKRAGKSKAAPILLSPASAMKQVNRQEFVFGTSSQLAREQSPTILRDLQRAMQESNQINDPFSDAPDHLDPYGYGVKLSDAKHSLWSAAARNSDGDTMDVEVMDMTTSPTVDSQSIHPLISVNGFHATTSLAATVPKDEWEDIDAEDVSGVSDAIPNRTAPPKIDPVEAARRLELYASPTSEIKIDSLSYQENNVKITKPAKKLNKAALEKPDYKSYTIAQLAKEIASYRFKPVKNRDQMITLLEKCWEGKHRIALGSLGANAVLSKPSTKLQQPQTASAHSTKMAPDSKDDVNSAVVSSKAGRGRPRKKIAEAVSPGEALKPKAKDAGDHLNSATPLVLRQTPKKSTKRTPIEDEISDSDTPITPSPPRRSPSKSRTPPRPLELVKSNGLDDLEDTILFTPISKQSLLHKHITQAIRSAPRSADPQNPSWHEKILLYDPIVLEDLATWLNTGALSKTGWDSEVAPFEVKKWCISRSICCLWRENLRGGTRARF